MSITSREYTRFKKQFVGPKLPRRILRKLTTAKAEPSGPINTPLNSSDERRFWGKKEVHRFARPAWANKETIDEIYKTAKKLTEETGIPHEVDHIVPVKHPLVCGLHVENNLQIITQRENQMKSNKFIIK
jgi:hypothetical protein